MVRPRRHPCPAARRLIRILFLAATLSGCGAAASRAAEIELSNGDRLHVEVLRSEHARLIVRHPVAGELAIPFPGIRRLTSDAPVLVETRDGLRRKGLLRIEAGRLFLNGESMPLDRLARINPPPAPSQWTWKGAARLGLDVRDGNQQLRRVHVDARLEGTHAVHRLVLETALDRETSDGVRTVDKSRIAGQYDRKFSARWFLGGNLRLEQDRFQDLRLRTTLGATLGYLFSDTARTRVSLEAGPSLVREDYYQADDIDFPTLGWKLDARHETLRFPITLYHVHTGQLSMEDTEDLLIQSRTGMELPVGNGLNTALEIDFDWDNLPAPGRERQDTRYLFKVGYSW